MRELTGHKVNGLNDKLKVLVRDEPGPGGAHHIYDILPTEGNASGTRIKFQKGPMGPDDPPNGLSNEALLVIVEDRLAGFQSGKFACHENEQALLSVRDALNYLHNRTRARVARGVEGTNTV